MPLKAEKRALRVLIYTPTHLIDGTYYMVPDARLSDDLNARQKDFIPLRQVKVSALQDPGRVLFETDFLAVNKQHIVLLSTHPAEGAAPDAP